LGIAVLFIRQFISILIREREMVVQQQMVGNVGIPHSRCYVKLHFKSFFIFDFIFIFDFFLKQEFIMKNLEVLHFIIITSASALDFGMPVFDDVLFEDTVEGRS
jgi:hypothetical protein